MTLPTIEVWVGFAQKLPRLAFRGVPRDAIPEVVFGTAPAAQAGCSSACATGSGSRWFSVSAAFDDRCNWLDVEITAEQSAALKAGGVMQVDFLRSGVLVGGPFLFPLELRKGVPSP